MTTRAKKPKQPRKPAAPEKKSTDGSSDDRKAKLGTKHVCFSCKTRFYDMNKPEPICPKCGADQRAKPKEDAKAKGESATPVKRPPPRPMPGLLDEEEETGAVPSFEDEMDLDLGELDTGGEELFEEDTESTEPAEDEAEEP
jgi:hypothetical protein